MLPFAVGCDSHLGSRGYQELLVASVPPLVGNVLDIFNTAPLVFIIGLTDFLRAGQMILANPQFQRSISPITTSSDPTIAGMSASRMPRQRGPVTERLQKLLLLARARTGIGEPSPTM